jgi:cell division protein FtsA
VSLLRERGDALGGIEMPNYITGLDIGTTKIGVVIGEVGEDDELRIVAVTSTPSEGLRRGVVINLEKTVQSIARAVAEAEQMAGVQVDSVYAGIAGDHIRSINGRGVVAVAGPNNEITEDDVRRVIDAARAVALPIDREIIHILPQEFIVDDQRGIKDPVGMAGVRLEAEVHIVTGAVTSAQNIYRSIERAGLRVRDLVLEPLASSLAVLTEDEKELGVVLIDLGGGTTDVAVFYQGCIRHTGVVGLGGRNVTNDIAIGLRTPVDQAEDIKIRYGCAVHRPEDDKETIEVPGIGGRASRRVSKALLVDIIQPRMEEILRLAYEEVKRSGFASLMNGGVVMTGGGSLLSGTLELAEDIFGVPVRLGIPQPLHGLREEARNPMHATGVGLVLYGLQQGDAEVGHHGGEAGLFDMILEKMRRWLGLA